VHAVMDSAIDLIDDFKIQRGKQKMIQYNNQIDSNMNLIIDRNEICHFAKLSLEIKIKIFKYLEISEIVCREWKMLAFDGSLWSNLDATSFYQSISSHQLLKLSKSAGGFLQVANFRGCIQLDFQHIRELARSCPNIHTLNLSGCRSLSNGSVNYLLSQLHNLRVLDVSGSAFKVNLTCQTLAKECKRLKKVNLNWCKDINSNDVEVLVNGCQELASLKINGLGEISESLMLKIAKLPELKILSMESCSTLSDDHVSALFKDNSIVPPLTHLNLSNNQLITDGSLKDIADYCKTLTHLQLNGCTNFTDNGFLYLASKCLRLEALDVEDCPCINDEVLQSFAAHLSNLKTICLSYCELISDDGVTALIRECINISHMDLDHCMLLTEALLENITRILTDDKSLEYQRLGDFNSRTKRPKHIEIDLSDCRNISGSAIKETIRKVADNGVNLELKGYYSWHASNNSESDDDEIRGTRNRSWIRNNRFVRRLTQDMPEGSLRRQLGAALRARVRGAIRSTRRTRDRANITTAGRGIGQCTIL
ncbi:13242_t:CDS:2, partial [Acaulospora morrowiae]